MHNRCPSCFTPLSSQHFSYRCQSAGCVEKPDQTASAYAGMQLQGRPVVRTSVPGGARCTACGTDAHDEVCPQCHFDLPRGWRHVATTCLAMAGARSSGKSIYIAVMKKQVELLATAMGGALGYATPQTQRIYTSRYEQPLFEARNLMQSTVSATAGDAYHREPLIFSLGTINGRTHALVIRDVAGEDLETAVANVTPFAFFREADAVLFLFDPMRIPQIKQQLAGIVPDERRSGGDPLVVLDNLIRLLRGGEDLSAARLRTPLGVVLAKFDTLQELTRVRGGQWASIMGNPGAAFQRDPSLWVMGYDQQDAALLQAEVESLLSGLGAQALLNKVDSVFEHRQLFAVSALGAPPFNSEDPSPRGVAPFRVVDPVKWALHRSGALPAV